MHQINAKTELENCNAVKAILMIFVVLYHSMAIYAGGYLGTLLTGRAI